MRNLIVCNSMSIDGFISDPNGDMRWAHEGSDDAEFRAFTAGNAKGGGELVLGRVTYDMMVGFWPTPEAHTAMPDVAKGMNDSPKVVFSRSMDRATWNNTRLFKSDVEGTIRGLKREEGPGLVVLGSASIVRELAQADLVDEYHLVVCPVILGDGKSMFAGVNPLRSLRLARSRTFPNGKTLLVYERAN
jgi:dihydrofolate reductase